MKKVFVTVISLFGFYSFAQNDPVIMTIGGKEVKKSEFESLYHKNGSKTIDKKSPEEYAQMFALYKMKVYEALASGLDTVPQFKSEFGNYKRQLANPYLSDKLVNDKVVEEAYERLKTEVKAAHIMVRCNESELPKDTLECWTRANLIRNAILGKFPTAKQIADYDKLLKNTTQIQADFAKKDSSLYKSKLNSVKHLEKYFKESGEDKFTGIAPKTSDDASVVDNHGMLGYFTAFDMVYPFENAAYTTKVGEISPIVRTKYGYHIVKVYDVRPSRGEMQVAHLMVKFPKDAKQEDKDNAKKKAFEIYEKIKKGELKFDDAVKQFSDDEQSKPRGGILPAFKSGRYPEAFENAAFKLQKDNDVSEPVESPYGWHIIKRVSLKTLPPFDTYKVELKAKIQKDTRSLAGRQALIAKVKQECKITETLKNRDEIMKFLDTTFLKGTWKAEKVQPKANLEIVKLCNKTYNLMDFAKYLESQMTLRSDKDTKGVMENLYAQWKDKIVIEFEDSRLEEKYPEYKTLLKEYHDGILLFDVTDKNVWSKAVKDTAGLREFYNKNKNKYMWQERVDVNFYKCADEKIAKEVRSMLVKKKTDKEITEMINKKSQLNLMIVSTVIFKGENPFLDKNWKQGIIADNYKNDAEKKVEVIVINKIIPASPKTLLEAKGQVTADYQNYLEVEWIKYLKNKYPVVVNQDVLKTVTAQ